MIIPSWLVAVAPSRRGSLWLVIRQLRALDGRLQAVMQIAPLRALPPLHFVLRQDKHRFAAFIGHMPSESREAAAHGLSHRSLGEGGSARPCITPCKRLEGAQHGESVPSELGAWRARLPEGHFYYSRRE